MLSSVAHWLSAHAGSPEILGEALNSDDLIEPVRGPLIPGFAQVKAAALKAGEQVSQSVMSRALCYVL